MGKLCVNRMQYFQIYINFENKIGGRNITPYSLLTESTFQKNTPPTSGSKNKKNRKQKEVANKQWTTPKYNRKHNSS
jgi:hypothetical protein